jgi:ATP synthase protein I
MSTRKIAPLPDVEEDPPFTPLTAEQARRLREEQPQVSPWWVVAGQVGMGLVTALAAWVLTGRQNLALSAGYGALVAAVPTAIFARGLGGRSRSPSPTGAVARVFVWEMVKIALSIVMLVMAPKVVAALSWPALLVGLVLAVKVYWVALVYSSRRRGPQRETKSRET